MSIGEVCKRSVQSAKASRLCQEQLVDYCNAYAQKLLGNVEFTFDTLPDQIVEVVFYGLGEPDESWSSFLKKEVRQDLTLMGYKV